MISTEDKELIISNYKTHVECGWYNDGRNLYQIAKKEAICFLSDKEIERLAKLNTIVYSDVWENNAVVGKPTVKLINEIKTILKETMQMINADVYHNYNLPLSMNEMLKEYPEFAGETFDYDYILDNLGNLYEATVGDSWEKLDTKEALTQLRQWQRSDYDTPEDEPAYFAVYKAFYGEFLDKLLTNDDVTFINQRNFEKTLINGVK